MKKIFLVVFLMIPILVGAKEIYSDDYYYEGENADDYPYKSDIYIERESNYLEDKPEDKLNRTILEENVIGYRSLEKVNVIVINNIKSSSYMKYYFNEIEIFYKNKKINYKASCINCVDFAEFNLSNGNINESDGYLTYSSLIYLFLDDYYDPEYLTIDISFYNIESSFSFCMHWYKDVYEKFPYLNVNNKYDYILFKNNIVKDKNILNFKTYKYSYSLNDDNIINYKWDNMFNIGVSNNKYFITDSKVFYKYIDKLYKYYKIVDEKKDLNIDNNENDIVVEKDVSTEIEEIIEEKINNDESLDINNSDDLNEIKELDNEIDEIIEGNILEQEIIENKNIILYEKNKKENEFIDNKYQLLKIDENSDNKSDNLSYEDISNKENKKVNDINIVNIKEEKINKILNKSNKFYKIRLTLVIIIILTLFLLGYMLYSLLKE